MKELMEIVANTNNGVEKQNKDLKHEYFKHFKENILSGVITVLIEQFLPAIYFILYDFCMVQEIPHISLK